MEQQKNELIAKLEDISAKFDKVVAIQSEMDEFTPEDHYEREISVPQFPGEYENENYREIWRNKLDHTLKEAVEIAERTHRSVFAPKKPEKFKEEDFKKPKNHALQEKQEKCKIRSFIGAGVGIFFFLGVFSCIQSGDSNVVPFVAAVALAGAAAFWFFRKKGNDAKMQEEQEVAEALAAHTLRQEARKAEHTEKMKAYEEACTAYEAELCKFMEDYKAWREIYLQSVAEEAQIAEKLEADRVAAVNKIHEECYVPAEAALKEANDLVSVSYLPVLGIIIDLLRSGRADGLKEAINLYEDIVYRERQLELEREKEEQRQREEEQRRRDEERRYQEDMRFRKEQERQRQREEDQRQKDAERRHKEEMDQRERMEQNRQYEERRQREEDRRRADRAELDRKQAQDRDTRDQCNRCAEVGHCSMSFRRPNCASFRPR